MQTIQGPPDPANPDEPLVPVPIPPLVTLLAALEKDKGSPLTEEEVLAIRDKAVCMTMPARMARDMAERRGYDDIDPEHVWSAWQAYRSEA